MKIYRGDIIIAPVYDERGSKRKIDHPQVVIQDTLINQSRVDSIVVCGLSTNMKRAFVPGNILLDEGEGNLPKKSIVVVSQVSTVKKVDIEEVLGRLSEERIQEIFSGINLIQSL